MPLSAASVELSQKHYQKIFDKLDELDIKLTCIELGNELNWAGFNGDFPMPGRGVTFTRDELATDPEAKQVAKGYLVYLKVLKVLKEVKDNSRLNHGTPIITSGMAASTGSGWQEKVKIDGVTIPGTYTFLRAHGLDELVDGYGVHTYPSGVKRGDKAGQAKREAEEERFIFPPGNNKPYWVTEWGFPSKAQSSSEDTERAESLFPQTSRGRPTWGTVLVCLERT
jgi:hypothetical protein